MNALQRPMLLLACAAALVTHTAGAEKADSEKPTQIDAKRGQYNDLKQTGWYEGGVVLIKGTLRIEGARLDFRKDPEGYEYAIIIGAKDQPATFRQRRDGTRPGIDEFVEGRAERIEYDGKAETIRLITRASWRRLENEQPRDEIVGNVIVYDSRNATYEAAGDTKNGDGLVRTIIAPRQDTAPTPSPAAPLKPATAPVAPPKPATPPEAPKS
jgi:lipopolysaccharide export system protein LptA